MAALTEEQKDAMLKDYYRLQAAKNGTASAPVVSPPLFSTTHPLAGLAQSGTNQIVATENAVKGAASLLDPRYAIQGYKNLLTPSKKEETSEEAFRRLGGANADKLLNESHPGSLEAYGKQQLENGARTTNMPPTPVDTDVTPGQNDINPQTGLAYGNLVSPKVAQPPPQTLPNEQDARDRALLARERNIAAGGKDAGVGPQTVPNSGGGSVSTQTKGPAGLAGMDDPAYLKAQEEVDANRQEAFGREQGTNNAMADITTAAQLQAKKIQDEAAEQQKKDVADRQIQQQRTNDAMTARQNDIQAKIDAVKDVDPQHWWKSRGVAGSIGAALAMGLGALGSGVMQAAGKGGMPNYAMEIINKSIDQDNEAQRTNLESEWRKITKGQELSKDMFAKDQWMQEQMSRNSEAKLGLVKTQLAALQSGTNSQMAKQQGDQMNQLIDQKSLDIQQKSNDRANIVYNRELEMQMKLAAIAARKGAGGTGDLTKLYAAYVNGLKPGQEPMSRAQWEATVRGTEGAGAPPINPGKGGSGSDKADVTINGVTFRGTSEKAAAKAKDQVENANALRGIIGEIRELRSKVVLTPADKNRLATLTSEGALRYPKLQTGTTRFNQGEIEMGKKVFGGGLTDKLGWTNDTFGTQNAALDVLDRQAKETIANGMGGLTPLAKNPPPSDSREDKPTTKEDDNEAANLGGEPE